MTNPSRNMSVLLRMLVVCVLTYIGVAYVSSANEPSDEEDQATTDDRPLEEEDESKEDEKPDADEELLERLLTFQQLLEQSDESDQEYSDDTRCIQTRQMRHYQVLSQRFVSFEMRQSDELYLIQFKQKCAGLQKNGSLAFSMHNGNSGRLCVNDDLVPIDGGLGGQALSHASCRIPSLEKITKVQLLQLERGLTSKRVE